ncbi:MAG: type II toxin-antitoxin system VapC family toxin [Gammaproteobacteria bacterium]|nr:type II toxin-antitoxin system VapC family toxin [Gammaproteobacteria bacterium]
MAIVFDGSAVIACLAPDEIIDSRLEAALRTNVLVAPPVWPDEVNNAILIMARRGRISGSQADLATTAFLALTAEVEPPDRRRVSKAVYPLAERYGLTIYDASYLELAQRRKLALATLDDRLRSAAKKAKVKTL